MFMVFRMEFPNQVMKHAVIFTHHSNLSVISQRPVSANTPKYVVPAPQSEEIQNRHDLRAWEPVTTILLPFCVFATLLLSKVFVLPSRQLLWPILFRMIIKSSTLSYNAPGRRSGIAYTGLCIGKHLQLQAFAHSPNQLVCWHANTEKVTKNWF